MANATTLKGFIVGMENMGAKFIKIQSEYIYFDIKIFSKIDNEEALKKASGIFENMFGLTIKHRKVV